MIEVRGPLPAAGIEDGIVTADGGIIRYAGATAAWERASGRPAPPPSGTILPGLIDIHCHGGGGHSFCTTDQEEALAAARHHASAGTTGIIASVVTAPAADMLAQVSALAQLAADGHILGIHLEGPFLSAARRGAQAAGDLLAPDPALAQALIEAGGGWVKVMTVAPELPGAEIVIGVLREAGVTAALGHTDASYDVMRRALDGLDGTALVTHLANGMPPLHHRSGGPVAAALIAASDGGAVVELIADGVHVDQGFSRLVFAAAAAGQVALVTDAMAAAGMPDGDYQLGPQTVRVEAGVARLADGEGPAPALAGGTSRLAEDVVRMIAAGLPAPAAVTAGTATPARVLGLADRGGLSPGMAADLVVTDGGRVQAVMRNGAWLAGS
jgi:N-acetylglucosamine-6-phosphate deacetylase